MPICKLCHEDRVLVRSHIIPDAFNRALKGGMDAPPVMLSNNPRQHPKRRPGGHYDEDLVCDPCERRFLPWDTCGADFFLNRLPTEGQPLTAPNGEAVAHQFENVDYTQLKLFAISLLWRASASSNEFFRRVQLGPYEEAARQLILNQAPGTADEFATMIVRWVARPPHEQLAQTQMSPYRAKLEGVNEVKLFLAGAVMHVKVDQRPYPEPFPELILRPDRPLVVIARELEGSKDILALRPALEAAAARARDKKRRYT
ncbi:MAG: hypothetical protein WBE65_04075 [Steroidobacteraceae bacterium]